jgi:sulfatase maturation enzyme AslB (radical SAM superfamily)
LPWEEQAYARALAGIAMLRRHGLRAGVLTVVTGESLAYPEEIVDHLVDLGMLRIFLKSVYPLGHAQKAWAQVGLEPREYGRFWKQAVKRCFAHNRAEIPVVERTLALLVRKVLWGQAPCYVDLSSPCGAVHGQIAYDLQGNIYPCDEGRFGAAFPVGNVASSTFQELVQHPSTLAFRRTSQTV